MNRRPWAPWELQFLREEYGGSLVRDIAAALGRGVDAVRARVLELDLKCRTTWTPELDEVLALMYPDTPAAEVAALLGATTSAVHQRSHVLGVKKAPGFAAANSRRQNLAKSPFTAEIAEVIELLYPDTRTQDLADFIGMPIDRVHAYASKQGWKKTPEFVRDTARLRTGPDHPMRAYQFGKGHVPANKGVKGRPAVGRARETLFKKGNRPHTWKPIGTYRINADGYLDQKVTDTGYPPRDWQAVHRLKWIEKNGPVPAGHVLRFKPGKRTTDPEQITPDSVECISLAENGLLNVWHANMPPELKTLMGTRIALSRMINKRQRALTEETS